MEIYKLQQIMVLAVCTLAGAVCGIVYDIFRAYRRCTANTPLKSAICDILFWAISAVIVYMTIHLTNNARLRWYEPIGVISGYVIYTIYLSRCCMGFLCRFIGLLGKIYNTFLKLAGIPKKILHKLILPFERYSLSVRTRLLYIRSNLTERFICFFSHNIKSAVLKKLRK